MNEKLNKKNETGQPINMQQTLTCQALNSNMQIQYTIWMII